MTHVVKTLALAAAVSVTAMTAALAAPTFGEQVAEGTLTLSAVQQIVSGTGYSVDEALALTLDDVAKIKWQDD